MVDDVINELLNPEPEYEMSWHTVAVIHLDALGEATITAGESGWLCAFGLNYTDCTPATDLAANHTVWSAALDNCTWYADNDGFSEDCHSHSGFYFVVRVKWNKTHAWDYNVNKWAGTKTRVNLTCSGDETIAGTSGTLVESYNSTSSEYMWCNYYWDDGVDGYRVKSDGQITISEIKLEAKF